MKTFFQRLSYENRLLLICLVCGLIPCFSTMLLLFSSELANYAKWAIMILLLGVVFVCSVWLKRKVITQLQNSSNLIEALCNHDYSMRLRETTTQGAMTDFTRSLNAMAEVLATQNLMTREKQILLDKVINQIDVAIIAIDHHKNISLMNPASERLFQCRFSEIDGWPIRTIGLHNLPEDSYRKVVEFTLERQNKKVYLHVDEYFEHGQKHQLVFISDIQSLLREEERQAWQKLSRVLSHEINNSLTPLASISDTLLRLISKQELDPQFGDNLKDGLAVIKERSTSLNEFLKGYQQLTKLPAPDKSRFNLLDLVNAIAPLFTQSTIQISRSNIQIYADKAQIEQVLVNLFKNAQEAMSDLEHADIRVCWQQSETQIVIDVIDGGVGVSNPDNLFVPFYTTKSHGCGIGLALSRQIISNHSGDLVLKNNDNGVGAFARITLPLLEK